jgi:hypothetical protein
VLWVTGNGRNEDYFAALHLGVSSLCVLIAQNQHLKASHERFKEVICFKGCLFFINIFLKVREVAMLGQVVKPFFFEGGVGLIPKRRCLLTLAYYAFPR